MRRSGIALTAGLMLLTLLASGCENPEAQRRAEVQAEIEEASEAFAAATAIPVSPGDERYETVQREVSGIAQRMSRLNEGGPGQQAAAQFLASTAHRYLAAMKMTALEEAEAERRQTRLVLQAEIAAAGRLAGLVEGQSQLRERLERMSLAEPRQAAERELRSVSARMAELDEPIESRVAENMEDMEAASALLARANERRREARQAGPAAGFGSFEEAVALEQEAAEHQYEVTQREIELEYQYQPLHDLAAQRVEQLQEALSIMQDAEQSIEQRREMTEEQVRELRDALRSMRSDIEEMLDRADAEALVSQYEEAKAELEKAASLAQRAIGGLRSSGGSVGLAAIAAAKATEKLGDLHSDRAAGLMGQAVILEQLTSLREAAGNPERYQERLQAVMSEAQAQMDAATAAYQAALEQLGQATGREVQQQVSTMRSAIQQRLGMEPEAPVAPPAEMTTGGRPDAGAAASPTGRGFASPEAFVEAVSEAAAVQDRDMAMRFMNAIHAESPQGRAFVSTMKRVTEASLAFSSAMEDAFGEAAMQQQNQQMGAMGGGMSFNFEQPSIVERTDERAVLQVEGGSAAMGDSLVLVNVDGRWYIDADSLVSGQDQMSMEMMNAMLGPMAEMLDQMAARVRAGEFSSPEEAMQAMMQGMMGGMGQ